MRTIQLNPAKADLRTRGFSAEIKYGEMIAANYATGLNDGRLKYFSGNFTRRGQSAARSEGRRFRDFKNRRRINFKFRRAARTRAEEKIHISALRRRLQQENGHRFRLARLGFTALLCRRMNKYPYQSADERFSMTAEKQKIYD